VSLKTNERDWHKRRRQKNSGGMETNVFGGFRADPAPSNKSLLPSHVSRFRPRMDLLMDCVVNHSIVDAGPRMEAEPDQLLPGRLAGHGQFERRRRCHIQHDAGPEISFVVNGIDVVIGGHYALATSDQLQPSRAQSSGNDISTLPQHIYGTFVRFLLVQSGGRVSFMVGRLQGMIDQAESFTVGGWKS
jgi:hypothetical protein